MRRASIWIASMWLFGCGGGEPPQTAADAEPAAATAPAEPLTSTESAPAPAADEAWEGETEAKTPAPASAAAPADGKAETRTMEVIQQVVKEHRQPVRDCFDKAKKQLPDLHGDMTIHFVIDPDGKVKTAELNQERSTLKSPEVVSCAVAEIQKIKFPPSSRGMDTTVNYPYNFK